MTTSRLLRAAAATAAIVLACPAAASAQIYAWRDAAGNLVLSDKAKDPSAKTYNIPSPASASAFRATRPFSTRAAVFQPLIEEHAALNTVSPDLVRAVIQAESAFNPRATSPRGAMGLMQLMPATAAELGVVDAYDPEENIRAGVKYLKQLLDTYDGKVELALAAYNAGPGAVKKYGGTVPPYRETRNYVAKIQNASTSEGTTGLAAPGERTKVYRVVEIVDGREVVRYTGTPREGSERVKAADRR
ncbi:MAG: lytic transglycosylase domain-containing protein [Burkholderiales bacterium]